MERFWRAVEAIHDVVYFAPEATARYTELGLRGFWRGYFASRAAALGTPGPELVTATFFGFAPEFVARAVPSVWELADREQVLATRTAVATDVLRTAWGSREVSTTADRLAEVVAGLDLAGRPLAAACAGLPEPTDPVARVWHHATVLRELHGDAHITALLGAGLDGATCNALAVATGLVPPTQREHRGWSEERWHQAYDELTARDWTDATGAATDTGRVAREDIERRTHEIADAALSAPVGDDLVNELVALARPLDGAAIPYPNPTGVPRP